MLRKAVGALVVQGDRVLLVHKVKMMDGKDGVEAIAGVWDLPKGGVKALDADAEHALRRELLEECGIENACIVREFLIKITFQFLPEDQQKLGFEGQETTMFLVEYAGDPAELQPQDEEIDALKFVKRDELLAELVFPEAREFCARWLRSIPG